jgi:hypothetical protein
VSPADPAARWTGAHGGQAFFAYSTNYLIDVEHAVIVDVEATTAIRQAEVLAAKRMIERSMDRFGLYPARLMGDSAYGSAEMLGWPVYEHGIEPHVTVFDMSARKDGTFSRDDFTYDHQHDVSGVPAAQRRARLERSSTTERRCSTPRFNANALDASSSPGAARTRLRGRSRARSMRVRATGPGRSQRHGKGPPLDGFARRSRCCSPTSSASSSSTGCD